MVAFENREMPKLDKLHNNFYGASFELMKLLPARFILEQAMKKRQLKKGDKIVETSSGTFALALAMISNVEGFELTIVSDPAIDRKLKMRLERLGTKVVIVDSENVDEKGGYQKLRLEKLYEILSSGNYFWPQQYDNLMNREAYCKYAGYLVENLGKIDYLIGPVGSGGSMVGTAKYLKKLFPDLKVVDVDTPNSVLFGQKNGERKLRGLGNSIHPENLDVSLFDYISWVPAELAFEYTKRLYSEKSLFMGPTSGATYLVGKYFYGIHSAKKIVCNFPDEGYRYIDTVYDNNWIKENDVTFSEKSDVLTWIKDPNEELGKWTIIDWKDWLLRKE
ncbi:pyridoxal-phosphate dependent enzyme [Ligilactobacillus murinus]|jgi:cysteine synthase A|uniref:Pyridoxal-phosphate dependent enzyme n=1 Tax=Ligilactobacillus murinus TaxID=1622 RepID=A0A4Q2AC07_9LACO|nr:pyridoxal-phosphate dependent enzyme [Ligilactobacillus murinus]NBH86650.1 pyridoxal-phosphate dependent enzyme [Lachnospiraceae bacterium]MBF0701737.1 pyridoxal-phosphate dependent enzyme [Ligilactobacillus murinus]MCZ0674923.1 pyridoxal-phosphate dependent enzyme [Ligilactobacillus murinus]MCZ0695470.1 pyridoxal-phosphate dependent enzyme [Ligilactobacillus murinus]MCZ0700614.1 pyridoxal-phosphate dependent enzyme [Ligilactobacillus murinus]